MNNCYLPSELINVIYNMSKPYMKCIIRRVCVETSKYDRNKYGTYTTLNEAIRHGNLELVQWLYNSGSHFTTKTMSLSIRYKRLNIHQWLQQYIPKSDQHVIDMVMLGKLPYSILNDNTNNCKCLNIVKNALHTKDYNFVMEIFNIIPSKIDYEDIEKYTDWLSDDQLENLIHYCIRQSHVMLVSVASRNSITLIKKLYDLIIHIPLDSLLLMSDQTVKLIIDIYDEPWYMNDLFSTCVNYNRLEIIKYIINKEYFIIISDTLKCYVDNRETIQYLLDNNLIEVRGISTCNTIMYDYAIENDYSIHISSLSLSLKESNYYIVDCLISREWKVLNDNNDVIPLIKYFIDRNITSGTLLDKLINFLDGISWKDIHTLGITIDPIMMGWVLNYIDKKYFHRNILSYVMCRENIQKMDILYSHQYTVTDKMLLNCNQSKYSLEWYNNL